jgi:hypothetical protein
MLILKKFLLALLSTLFLLVTVFAGTRLGMEGLCALSKCAQDMRKGDAPSRYFHVIVRLPSEGNRLIAVRLDDWPDFHTQHPDSTLTLQAPTGATDDGWWYTVMSADNQNQRIRAHSSPEDPVIDVDYETHGETVKPLYSKALNVGHMFSALPVGIFLAWLMRRMIVAGLARGRAK